MLEQYRIGRLTAALSLVGSGLALWWQLSGRASAGGSLWRYWPVFLVLLAIEALVASRRLYNDDRPGFGWDFVAVAVVCVLTLLAAGLQQWEGRRVPLNQFVSPFNDNRYTLNLQQEVALADINRLRVENSSGKVKIKVGDSAVIRVETEIVATGDNVKEAEDLARGVKLLPATVTKQLSIAPELPSLNNNQDLTCNLTLTLPDQTLDVEIINRFGAVEIEDGQGALHVEDKNGNVTVTNQRGNVTIAGDFGNTRVKGISGDLNVQVGNGTVDVEQVKGNVTAHSGFGRVELRKIEGKATVDARNGGVVLTEVAGDSTVTSTFGSTEINNPKSQVAVNSDNGSITMTGSGPLLVPLHLESRFGSIRVRVAKTDDLQVDAASEFGRLELPSGLSVNKEGSRSTGKGTLGENGPLVYLRSDNGSITLEMK